MQVGHGVWGCLPIAPVHAHYVLPMCSVSSAYVSPKLPPMFSLCSVRSAYAPYRRLLCFSVLFLFFS